MTSRFVVLTALFLAAFSARAAEPTPTPQVRWVNIASNLEVTVINGSTTVFKGFTDASGRFETTPLEPGDYVIQLRIPKTMITPARYTLALSGARPLGDALVGPGVALAMKAKVRRAGPVRGLVNGRRVRVATPTPAVAATPAPPMRGSIATRPASAPLQGGSNPTVTSRLTPSAPARSAGTTPSFNRTGVATPTPTMNNPAVTRTMEVPLRTAVSPTPVALRLAPRPANSQPRFLNGRRYIWVASGHNPNLGSWVPENTDAQPINPAPPATSTASTPVRPPLAAPAPSTAPVPLSREPKPSSTQPQIMNGRRYIWVASPPGSNRGYWALDETAAQPTNPVRSNVPAAPPAPRPSPSLTPRRR